VDSAHPVVRAHARHVIVKEVEAHKGKRKEAQTQESEKFQEERRKQQGLPLRRPNPVIVPLIQCIDKERVSPADKPTLETADIDTKPARRDS